MYQDVVYDPCTYTIPGAPYLPTELIDIYTVCIYIHCMYVRSSLSWQLT